MKYVNIGSLLSFDELIPKLIIKEFENPLLSNIVLT